MDRYVRYAALTGYAELACSVGLDPARLMSDVREVCFSAGSAYER